MSYTIGKHIVFDYDKETPVWHAFIPTETSTGKPTHLSGMYIDPDGIVLSEQDGEVPINIMLHLIDSFLHEKGTTLLIVVQEMVISQVLNS